MAGKGIALIGAGMIGKRHVQALSAVQDRARLVAVMTRNPQRAAAMAEVYAGPAPRFTSDLADLCRAEVDAVIVATPPAVREEVIGPLVAAGKHILLEKPVARTLAEAEAVVRLCEAAGVTLGMVFQHRLRGSALAAEEVVAHGRLGRLGHVEIAVPLWRSQSYYDALGRGTYARDGGGVLLTNAIHSINLALGFTGAVQSVQAMTATSPLHRMEAEDVAVAGLRFGSGAVGSLVASTASYPHRTEVIRLHYDHGSLRLDKDGLEVDWREGRHERIAEGLDGAEAQQAWHARVIADFLEALQAGRAPKVTGREALAAHELIDAIERSSRDGAVVALG